jgi:23S rRNA (pseudouridine1915-N3)-methyltransferase
MKITFLLTGKTKKGFIEEGVNMYAGRIKHYVPFTIIEIPDHRLPGKAVESAVKEKEGDMILKSVGPSDTLILLDERGRMISSVELADFIREKSVGSYRNILFVAGGAYGFSKKVYDRADGMISLSRMTFSHQVVRIMFLEQLYRAFTIIRNEPYHHG